MSHNGETRSTEEATTQGKAGQPGVVEPAPVACEADAFGVVRGRANPLLRRRRTNRGTRSDARLAAARPDTRVHRASAERPVQVAAVRRLAFELALI